MHAPPINNLDLSISKRVTIYGRSQFEFRVDMFNALNHTQFTGVNATANFASLTDPTITNLPYDASGKLTPAEWLRHDQRRRAAALAATRHARDLLEERQTGLEAPMLPGPLQRSIATPPPPRSLSSH